MFFTQSPPSFCKDHDYTKMNPQPPQYPPTAAPPHIPRLGNPISPKRRHTPVCNLLDLCHRLCQSDKNSAQPPSSLSSSKKTPEFYGNTLPPIPQHSMPVRSVFTTSATAHSIIIQPSQNQDDTGQAFGTAVFHSLCIYIQYVHPSSSWLLGFLVVIVFPFWLQLLENLLQLPHQERGRRTLTAIQRRLSFTKPSKSWQSVSRPISFQLLLHHTPQSGVDHSIAPTSSIIFPLSPPPLDLCWLVSLSPILCRFNRIIHLLRYYQECRQGDHLFPSTT